MKVIDCEQGTVVWAMARRGIPTASCFDKIVTPAKGEFSKSSTDYACQLIAESMLPPHYWIQDDVETRDMRRGKATEEEARDYLMMELRAGIDQVGFVTTDDGRYGCSPDGLQLPQRGVELKCPEHKRQVRYLHDGILPVEYKPQVHGCMIVTGLPEWIFMSYAVGLPPLIIYVKADDYTAKVSEALEKFHAMYSKMRERFESAGDPVSSMRVPYESPF